MDIQALKVFRTVAQNGSFSAAAQEMNYAQSNISTKIQNLEKELNTALFYRYNRGITLTPKGQLLLQYSDSLLHLFDETEDAMRDDGTARGPLALGSMETTACVHLPRLLAEYHTDYPQVQLSLTTGNTARNAEKILDHTIDGAFIAGPIKHPELTGIPFTNETLYLVTDSQQPPLSSWSELQNRTLLVFPQGCSYRARLEQLLQQEELLPERTIEISSLNALIASLCAGLGISLLPESVIRPYTEHGLIRKYPVPSSICSVSTFFVYRRNHINTMAFTKFLEAAAAYQETCTVCSSFFTQSQSNCR